MLSGEDRARLDVLRRSPRGELLGAGGGDPAFGKLKQSLAWRFGAARAGRGAGGVDPRQDGIDRRVVAVAGDEDGICSVQQPRFAACRPASAMLLADRGVRPCRTSMIRSCPGWRSRTDIRRFSTLSVASRRLHARRRVGTLQILRPSRPSCGDQRLRLVSSAILMMQAIRRRRSAVECLPATRAPLTRRCSAP